MGGSTGYTAVTTTTEGAPPTRDREDDRRFSSVDAGPEPAARIDFVGNCRGPSAPPTPAR